jgi:ABC-2 type transport system permease protein
MIFLAFGAAAIFANDYRWETWRLISSRNTRANLLWAKIVVYGLAIALSIIAIGFASIVSVTYATLLNGAAPTLPAPGLMLQISGVAVASWLELLVLGTFTALASVISRSMIGAMISAVVFAIIQLFAMTLLFPVGISAVKLAAVPHFSARVFSAFAVGHPITPTGSVQTNIAVLAASYLICWTALLGILAMIIFQRQDLARE